LTDVTDSLIGLRGRLREIVLPALGTHAAGDHAGMALGGDAIFGVDQSAEALLMQGAHSECVRRGIAGLRRPEA
jgi:hypothetical protein